MPANTATAGSNLNAVANLVMMMEPSAIAIP